MARGINKVCEFELYSSGKSIPECSEITGIPLSTLRFRFKKAGILRSRTEGVRIAAHNGKLSHLKGTTRVFTDEWKKRISESKLHAGLMNAESVSKKPSGYLEITRGKNKGKRVHVVVMETHLGRPLIDGEVVHHIDSDKTNNHIDNLALLTRSGHARLHRFEDQLSGKQRERNNHGQWN